MFEVFKRTKCLDVGKPFAKFSYVALSALLRPDQVQSLFESMHT